MSFNRLTCDITITDEIGSRANFKECIGLRVNKSYKTLTNTAEVTLPLELQWIQKDKLGYNTRSILKTGELFKKGDHIDIKIGYDFNNKTVFRGYITGIEPKSPFTLICEDAMWLLKKNRLKLSYRSSTELSEIIGDLLQDTGVELHPISMTQKIKFGKLRIENMTTAQLLDKWKSNHGLLSYIKDDKLVIGRSFFSSSTGVFKHSKSPDYIPPSFDTEVDLPADGDDLILDKLDYNTIAVKAISKFSSNKNLEVTVIFDPDDVSKMMIIDEVDTRLSKNEQEQRKREIITTLSKKNIFPENYDIRTIHEFNLERDQLIASAQDMLTREKATGFSGTFTTFGDHALEPATSVYIIDPRNPDKNGEYLIEGVGISFDRNGYRQTVSIPNKLRDI